MNVNFFEAGCQTHSSKRKFGLCDEPPPSREHAYIDDANGENWIAAVDNFYEEDVTFTGIDHCVEFPLRKDGKARKRCDGMLTWANSVAFVELKQRTTSGSEWVKEADKQLRVAIDLFEDTPHSERFTVKRAYIANSERPRFRESQAARMENFAEETNYVLRIEARISLY